MPLSKLLTQRLRNQEIVSVEAIQAVPRLMPNSQPAICVAVAQNKGGVGKSTVANGLVHGLALDGFKVAMVEVEISPRAWEMNTPGASLINRPEPSQSVMRLFQRPDLGLGVDMYRINTPAYLASIPSLSTGAREKLIAERHWGNAKPFFLMPGHPALWELNANLLALARQFTRGNKALLLHQALERGVTQFFDVVVFDTTPSRNDFQTNVFFAQPVNAGPGVQIIIPVDFDPDASAQDYLLTVDNVREAVTEAQALGVALPEILGVVFNKYEGATDQDDVALLRAYTQLHPDDYGKQQPAIVQYPQLGRLPMDTTTAKRAIRRKQSPLTLNPSAKEGLGLAMYEFVKQVERSLRIDVYIK